MRMKKNILSQHLTFINRYKLKIIDTTIKNRHKKKVKRHKKFTEKTKSNYVYHTTQNLIKLSEKLLLVNSSK